MANELHTFTGNEVIATELPELLNQNFDYVRENSLKSVNGVEKDENNNVDVTFLTSQVIPTNSDLNNFRESGEYTREVDTVVVINSPTEKPFFLTVLASENLVKQVVTEIDRKDPMTFTRTLSGANWSPWVEGGVDIGIWKSEETVKVGDVRFLKGRENAGYVLECVTAGVTGENQPVLEGNVAEEVFDLNNFDGTLSIEKGGIGATKLIRKKNAPYDVGDVVYNETNGKVALKCTTAGTTSNSVLDISTKNIGDTVTDGSVVWSVVSRSETYNTYTTFEELKLTGTPTLTQILEAMPSKSKFIRYINSATSSSVGVPDGGILEIVKGNYNDYASLRLQRYGGDAYLRKTWYESWTKGQTTFKWEKLLDSNDFATQSEAEAGSLNNKIMTPQQTKNAIDARNFATKGALSMPNVDVSGITVSVSVLTDDGYTAPNDGWLVAAFTSSAGTNNWCRLYNTTRTFMSVAGEAQSNHICRLLLPMAKGTKVKASNGSNISLDNAYFYTAQSEA